jgi:hypothetical protein
MENIVIQAKSIRSNMYTISLVELERWTSQKPTSKVRFDLDLYVCHMFGHFYVWTCGLVCLDMFGLYV